VSENSYLIGTVSSLTGKFGKDLTKNGVIEAEKTIFKLTAALSRPGIGGGGQVLDWPLRPSPALREVVLAQVHLLAENVGSSVFQELVRELLDHILANLV
jgi:hypothetical protein